MELIKGFYEGNDNYLNFMPEGQDKEYCELGVFSQNIGVRHTNTSRYFFA